jgi:hypothetical protein
VDPAKDYTIAEANGRRALLRAEPHQRHLHAHHSPLTSASTRTTPSEHGGHLPAEIRHGAILAEELKKEWYKLGTDFGIGAGDNETTITLSGLDENFEASPSPC